MVTDVTYPPARPPRLERISSGEGGHAARLPPAGGGRGGQGGGRKTAPLPTPTAPRGGCGGRHKQWRGRHARKEGRAGRGVLLGMSFYSLGGGLMFSAFAGNELMGNPYVFKK